MPAPEIAFGSAPKGLARAVRIGSCAAIRVGSRAAIRVGSCAAIRVGARGYSRRLAQLDVRATCSHVQVHARELTRRLADLLRVERGALADFLVALASFDRDRCWEQLGHTSLFYFLYRELGLSKGAAYHRKVAAELLQKFPEVLEPLRDGRLCITSIVELAKVITPDNRAEVLPRYFNCSKREAMAVSAEILPRAAPHRVVVTAAAPIIARVHAQPARRAELFETSSTAATAGTQAVHQRDGAVDVGGSVIPVPVHPDEPAGAAVGSPSVQPVPDRGASADPVPVHPDEPAGAGAAALQLVQLDEVVPLTADLRRLHITVNRRFVEKLEAARDALSHARPGATFQQVLESGLDLVLQRHARRKGVVEKPRARQRARTRDDYIPAEVKRQVWIRDGGCCQMPLESGGICGSKVRVEFDHVRPRARNGPATVENVRLLCRPHNQLAARRIFGDEFMARFGSKRDSRGHTPDARKRPATRSDLVAPRNPATSDLGTASGQATRSGPGTPPGPATRSDLVTSLGPVTRAAAATSRLSTRARPPTKPGTPAESEWATPPGSKAPRAGAASTAAQATLPLRDARRATSCSVAPAAEPGGSSSGSTPPRTEPDLSAETTAHTGRGGRVRAGPSG